MQKSYDINIEAEAAYEYRRTDKAMSADFRDGIP